MSNGSLSLGLVFMCLIPALGAIAAFYRIIVPDAPFTMMDIIPFQILLFIIGFLLIAESLFGMADGE